VQPPVAQPPAAGDDAAGFSAHAIPLYRLVPNQGEIDTPSRLLVLQLRLEGGGDSGYAFSTQDLAIVFADGSRARVFDRARAFELLRRTIIAEADLSYLRRRPYVPGGIAPPARQPVAERVAGRLLGDGMFDAANPLQGFVIVDTGAARTSMDGAVVEVLAHRLSDSAPSRVAYQLATAPHAPASAP
jgi:hypothetical protein